MSTRELCRLQTFPDDYRIMGGRTEVQRQLGNAVPSLIGEILGREIKSQFFQVDTNSPLKLLTEINKTVYEEHVVKPVPEKYLGLLGNHREHQGTGKGPKASATRTHA